MRVPTEEFDQFEIELSHALRRVAAPEGMADAVMEGASKPKPILMFPRLRPWMGSVAASILVLGLAVGGVERHRAAERARAAQNFARSLEITQRALEPVRDRLQRAGIKLDE